jgi:hypothetical protein
MRLRHFLATLVLVATTATSFSQENDSQFDLLTTAVESVSIVESTSNVTTVTPLLEEIPVEHQKTYPFLTSKQSELLNRALEIGKSDNHKNPEILQGILMQETKAGAAEYKSAKNNCFGIFQIKIAAAQDVLKNFPELVLQFGISPTNTTKLRHKLIHDDEFNISVASKYLLILKRYGYVTIKELSLAYNQGAGGAKRLNPNTFGYSISVVKHIKRLN